MTTTILEAMTQLNKDLNDHWAGTTTTSSGTSTVTLIDTALQAKQSDWITDDTYVFVTSATSQYSERLVSSLSSSTLTFLAVATALTAGNTYQIHRLFTPTKKKEALIVACKASYPDVYINVRDESKTTGNWLINGDFEKWTVSTTPDSWTASALTPAVANTVLYYYRGSSACKLTGTAGYIGQGWADNDELRLLRGQKVRFSGKGWSSAASCLRLAILSGTTLTYSDYDPGSSHWTDEDDDWYVEADIDDHAANVAFRVYSDVAAATSYIDDVRVTGPRYDRVYVGDLNLAQDKPMSVRYASDAGLRVEPWQPVHNVINERNGWIDLPGFPQDKRLRIEGYSYPDFLSSGVASTSWSSSIAVDDPQIQIITAEAARYLYQQNIQENMVVGDSTPWQNGYAWWTEESKRRKNQYRMPDIPIRVNWGQR